jgi:hypothetical protein
VGDDLAPTMRTWANTISRESFLARANGLYLLIKPPAADAAGIAFTTQIASHDRLMKAAEEVQSRIVLAIAKSERSPFSGQISVGRARNCDIVLRDASVSKLHAHFSQRGTEWQVTDRGSANGTSLDGKRLAPDAPTTIAVGAKVTFGTVECVVADGAMLFHELGPDGESDD